MFSHAFFLLSHMSMASVKVLLMRPMVSTVLSVLLCLDLEHNFVYCHVFL